MSTVAPDPVPEERNPDTPVERDLLDDLAAVLGDERIPAADVPALLRDLAPDHEPYRTLSGNGLRERLDREYGIRLPATKNRFPIDLDTIRDHRAGQGRDAGHASGPRVGPTGGPGDRWVGPARTTDEGSYGPDHGSHGGGGTR